MERPLQQPIGTPVTELDTPAPLLDLATLEANIREVHGFFEARPAKLRPHVKSHNCPSIARLQLRRPGTVGGICVAKVGQAEVFAACGFDDILVANQVVTRPKIDRLCALARQHRVTVAVDDAANVRALSDAALRHGVALRALVDVNIRSNRCGVEPGQEALELARAVVAAPGLEMAGLMSYEGCIVHDDFDDTVAETKRVFRPALETKALLERSGVPVETLSVGGTHNYEVVGAMPGVTEVQAGSYAVMDNSYAPYRPMLSPSLKILATVISVPEAGRAVVDVGQKAIGSDQRLPTVEGLPGARVGRLSAEHGILDLDPSAPAPELGSQVRLVPYDAELCLSLYNYVNAVQDARLAAVWPVSARGRWD